jgi:DNA recombination protein RmuC
MTVLLTILVAVNLAGLFLLYKRLEKPKDSTPDQGLTLLLNQFNNLSQTLDQKLGEGNKTMHEFMSSQSTQAQKLMSHITKQVSDQLLEVVKGVSETRESTKQVFTIAEQLNNLEKVLKNQKQRGNLGEASLELVMSNILPPNAYTMQYSFPDGDTVDAVIHTKEGMIPVDAKFPLENYSRLHSEKDDVLREGYEEAFRKDLKKRIDETSKYIKPKDGTLPFAFMYIPAEGIYYDLLNDGIGAVNTRNLIDYAQGEKKVIIVSPTTFSAYLQSVLYGFKAFKIEEQAKDIAKNVEALGRHLKSYEDYYTRLGNSLSTTINHYNAGYKELGKVDKDVLRITGTAAGFETLTLDKPSLEE